MSARSELLATIAGIDLARLEPALGTRALLPENRDHNAAARILRRGLYVVSFNALETFFKARMAELLTEASATQLSFSDLPPKLQEAAVRDALQNAVTQARFEDSGQDLALLQDAANAVASTVGGASLRLHEYSFLHRGSNVTREELKKAIAAMHVRDPWGQMDDIAAACRISTLPLEAIYATAVSKRNGAAHSASSSIEVSDLEALSSAIPILAMTYDICISAAFLDTKRSTAHDASSPKRDVAALQKFKVVQSHARGVAEIRADGRPRKVFSDAAAAVSDLQGRLRTHENIVLLSSSSAPVDWYPFGY